MFCLVLSKLGISVSFLLLTLSFIFYIPALVKSSLTFFNQLNLGLSFRCLPSSLYSPFLYLFFLYTPLHLIIWPYYCPHRSSYVFFFFFSHSSCLCCVYYCWRYELPKYFDLHYNFVWLLNFSHLSLSLRPPLVIALLKYLNFSTFLIYRILICFSLSSDFPITSLSFFHSSVISTSTLHIASSFYRNYQIVYVDLLYLPSSCS